MERQYCRLQRAALLAGIMVGGPLLMGQVIRQPRAEIQSPLPQSSPEIIEEKIKARHFVLVDSNNKERASLVTDGAGSVFFVLFDKDEKARADVSVTPYGPSINFYDPNGKARTIIGSTNAVSSHIVNAGIVERNPPSSIVLFDKEGKLLWRTP